MSDKMTITKPKAKYGDKVCVFNYRCRPAKWVIGECRTVQYKCGFGGSFHWQYDVAVESRKGVYFLYVGDKGIDKTRAKD